MSTYTLQVTFTRESDEETVAPKDLVKQFVKELQEFAYDDGWLDGDFQVNSITIEGETHEIPFLG